MIKNIKKAQQGIGVLISFITVVIVVSIAAAVITSTASSLESTSLKVDKETKSKISSSVEVAQVVMTKGGVNGKFTSGQSNVSLVLKLRAGSDVSRISDLLLQFGTPFSSQAIYASGNSSYDSSSFGYSYLVKGGANKDGYISEGDLVEFTFTFAGTNDISEGDNLILNIVHSDGGVVPIKMTAPHSILADSISMYP